MPSSEIYSLALHDALPISMPTSPILAAVCICRSAITSEQSTRLLFFGPDRSEEHTSELQSLRHLVCRLPRSTLLPYTTLFRSPCRPVPYSLPSASAGVRSRASRAPVCCSSDLTDRKSTRLNSSHLGISYAVFRDLLSCPTRRSSDLHADQSHTRCRLHLPECDHERAEHPFAVLRT